MLIPFFECIWWPYMTIHNKFKQRVLIAGVVFLTAGCTVDLSHNSGIDYKSASQDDGPRLDVPPDLTQLQRSNRYAIPNTGENGVVTASGYSAQLAQQKNTSAEDVAPDQVGNVRIMREGTQRWLVVAQSADALWPKLETFWKGQGFNLKIDSPSTGTLETDWAENRANIPDDIIRRTLGKVFDSLYSTGMRDKFRTRVERNGKGQTEIYITHQGVQEELTGRDKETTVWTPRPNDPGLETEFLMRLMVALGDSEEHAKAQVQQVSAPVNIPAAEKPVIVKTATGSAIKLSEGFDGAWRRVGQALDRAGFTVEDRDRTKGVYYVRYVDTVADDRNGFFSRIFRSRSDDKTALQYQIQVKDDGTGKGSAVTVLDKQGQTVESSTTERMLNVLNDQLQ